MGKKSFDPRRISLSSNVYRTTRQIFNLLSFLLSRSVAGSKDSSGASMSRRQTLPWQPRQQFFHSLNLFLILLSVQELVDVMVQWRTNAPRPVEKKLKKLLKKLIKINHLSGSLISSTNASFDLFRTYDKRSKQHKNGVKESINSLFASSLAVSVGDSSYLCSTKLDKWL